MPCYFIQAGDNGPIKIGVAKNVRRRLDNFRVASPVPLALIGVADGDGAYEHELHQRFSGSRIRGEWFHPSPELMAFVETLPKPQPRSPRIREGNHPLRRYRMAHGITLERMAKRLDSTAATVSRIEARGLQATHKLLIKIAHETGISIDDLVHSSGAEV